jgi:hypothetical protein
MHDLALTLREINHQGILQIVCHPTVPYNIVMDTWSPRSVAVAGPCATDPVGDMPSRSSTFGASSVNAFSRQPPCASRMGLIATVVY